MTPILRWVAVLGLALRAASWAGAADLRPFVPGSAEEIRRAHAGRPYIVALWSLGCPHCQEELTMLGALRRGDPALPLVLISTDTPEDQAALTATLRHHGLEATETWVFADAFSERLRFELDRRWQGELPRSYLVSGDGTVQSVSGRLERATLERWLAAQRAGAAVRAKQPAPATIGRIAAPGGGR